MRARILEAGIRVLREEGPLGFTTTRVADAAGISVGSLYQYFPNKHAIVMALHAEDVREGWERIRSVLDGEASSPRQKLDELVLWFFSTEANEVAQLGSVVGLEVFLGDDVDADLYAAAAARFAAFVDEASATPRTPSERRFAAELLMTTVEAVGKALAARSLPPAATRRWASEISAMLADHLDLVDDRPASRPIVRAARNPTKAARR